MNLSELYSLAKHAATAAGSFLLENKHKKKEIYIEEGRDIKLELDRESEILIKSILNDSSIPVIGEEFGRDFCENTNLTWVVDPIDGTSNYYRGIDQCCVSIALMEKDISKVGVIYNFNTKELFSAFSGGGAFLNEKKINVSDIEIKSNASLTTGFTASESLKSSYSYLNELGGWKKVRMFGSAALSCAYVASGRCDVYAEKGVYIWDIAAGMCLVEEAGGKIAYEKIDEDRYAVNFTNGRL